MGIMVEFGLKLWSINSDLIHLATETIDETDFSYVVIMPVHQSHNPAMFENLPIKLVHVTSEKFDFNPGLLANQELNNEILKYNLEWGRYFDIDGFIVHPGFGDFETSKMFFKNIKNDKILIENMPRVGLNGEPMVGSKFEELVSLTQGKGSCVDLAHTFKSAITFNIDPYQFLKDLMLLKPKVIHLSDTSPNTLFDEHKVIKRKSFIDFSKVCEIIRFQPSIKYLTIEIPRKNPKSFVDDIVSLENFIQVWSD